MRFTVKIGTLVKHSKLLYAHQCASSLDKVPHVGLVAEEHPLPGLQLLHLCHRQIL